MHTRRRLTTAAALLALAPAALAGCGGDDGTATTAAEPAATTEAPAESQAADTAGGGNAEAGAAVWESAGCGNCHTLGEAGATGNIGPSLDETKPSEALVIDRVTNGLNSMPAYPQLDEQQIADVAAYVAASTQK